MEWKQKIDNNFKQFEEPREIYNNLKYLHPENVFQALPYWIIVMRQSL
jgi:hypothetical protein